MENLNNEQQAQQEGIKIDMNKVAIEALEKSGQLQQDILVKDAYIKQLTELLTEASQQVVARDNRIAELEAELYAEPEEAEIVPTAPVQVMPKRK